MSASEGGGGGGGAAAAATAAGIGAGAAHAHATGIAGAAAPAASASATVASAAVASASSSSSALHALDLTSSPAQSLTDFMRARDPFAYGTFPTAGRLPHSLQTPFTESCLFKSAVNGVIGGGMGVAWGLFSASMGSSVNSATVLPGMPGYVDPTTLSTREALRMTARDMYRASASSARNFGALGALYTLSECTIEKARGTHDLQNALAAGCATGGLMGARGGPQAACLGCVGFAAFSYVMDRFIMNM